MPSVSPWREGIVQQVGEILVGTSSWTDPTLIASGWYPAGASSAEARLRHYAAQFPLVEVDATYYGMPSERNSVLWVERTPASFTFDIKAFGSFTQHPVEARGLPSALRHAFRGARVAYDKIPGSVMDLLFEQFASALLPLHSAGKLGFVLFQFPPWFAPSARSRDWVERCQERLPNFRLAIEFRDRAWLEPPDETLAWLRDRDLPMVIVDAPGGFDSSMPAVLETTASDLAVVRFHGRNSETWEAKGQTAAERFNYRYDEQELREWVAPIRAVAEQVRHTHVLFNNCYADHGVTNAKRLAELVGAVAPEPPEPPSQPSLLDA